MQGMAHAPKETDKKQAFVDDTAKPDLNDLLVKVGRDRDKESFTQLFEYFAPRVKSFLMRGGTPEETADELAQETMLNVWHKAERYDPAQAAASTWIFTIARNKKIDALRKAGRGDFDRTDMVLIDEDSVGPSENVMHLEESEAIAEALHNLPEEQSALLHKSFFEGKSHAEIADETDIPLGTVKSRIRLALERLRGQNKIRELR